MAKDSAVGEAVVLDDAVLPLVDGDSVGPVAYEHPEGGSVVAQVCHLEANVFGRYSHAEDDGVATAEIDQVVASVAAIEDVDGLPRPADKEVIAGGAGEGIISSFAIDGVNAHCPTEKIVGNASLNYRGRDWYKLFHLYHGKRCHAGDSVGNGVSEEHRPPRRPAHGVEGPAAVIVISQSAVIVD